LDKLKGKNITIFSPSCNMIGTLLDYKTFQYYYTLVLKIGRYKKKIEIFYPFDVKIKNE
jgi:hypothetical protein